MQGLYPQIQRTLVSHKQCWLYRIHYFYTTKKACSYVLLEVFALTTVYGGKKSCWQKINLSERTSELAAFQSFRPKLISRSTSLSVWWGQAVWDEGSQQECPWNDNTSSIMFCLKSKKILFIFSYRKLGWKISWCIRCVHTCLDLTHPSYGFRIP